MDATYTVVSKTEKFRDLPAAELRRDPERVFIGQRAAILDLPSFVTITGDEAAEVKLGDRFKLTLEQIA